MFSCFYFGFSKKITKFSSCFDLLDVDDLKEKLFLWIVAPKSFTFETIFAARCSKKLFYYFFPTPTASDCKKAFTSHKCLFLENVTDVPSETEMRYVVSFHASPH